MRGRILQIFMPAPRLTIKIFILAPRASVKISLDFWGAAQPKAAPLVCQPPKIVRTRNPPPPAVPRLPLALYCKARLSRHFPPRSQDSLACHRGHT